MSACLPLFERAAVRRTNAAICAPLHLPNTCEPRFVLSLICRTREEEAALFDAIHHLGVGKWARVSCSWTDQPAGVWCVLPTQRCKHAAQKSTRLLNALGSRAAGQAAQGAQSSAQHAQQRKSCIDTPAQCSIAPGCSAAGEAAQGGGAQQAQRAGHSGQVAQCPGEHFCAACLHTSQPYLQDAAAVVVVVASNAVHAGCDSVLTTAHVWKGLRSLSTVPSQLHALPPPPCRSSRAL